MTAPEVRVVCFDLGGVVVRICHTWTEGCRAVGLDVRGDMDTRLNGDPGWTALQDAYQKGAMELAVFATELSALMGGVYSAEEVTRVHRGWTLGAYDGIDDLIARVHAAGLETAVLSNTCGEHWEILNELPVFRTLRNRWGSHQLALRKPDPDAYRAVEAKLGVRGAEIAFFDDMKENVESACAVGWRAERVDPAGDTAEQITGYLRDMNVPV
ncbi:MAG: HAD-IA family hydrolase [Planctomycetes bacterium]|nr:HAD-IA family hydrolase [Planctomycetota bacterium]